MLACSPCTETNRLTNEHGAGLNLAHFPCSGTSTELDSSAAWERAGPAGQQDALTAISGQPVPLAEFFFFFPDGWAVCKGLRYASLQRWDNVKDWEGFIIHIPYDWDDFPHLKERDHSRNVKWVSMETLVGGAGEFPPLLKSTLEDSTAGLHYVYELSLTHTSHTHTYTHSRTIIYNTAGRYKKKTNTLTTLHVYRPSHQLTMHV